jgi:hypothetical protein
MAVPSRPGLPTWTSPANVLHSSLTPKDREIVQDWMARRYLQLHEKRIGRRHGDLPMPASVRSASQAERLARHIQKALEDSKA